LGIVINSHLAIWGRIPVTIFESIWAILIAIFCYLLLLRKDKYFLPDGLIFLSGLGLYAFGRLGLDFLRDEDISFWIFKTGQVGSLIFLIIIAIIIFLITKTRRRHEGY